jgi:glycosyltransferase involved in cell wall biosynthesis
MRIGVFLPQPWRGGMLRAVQAFCCELLRAADRLGWDVDVVLSVCSNTYLRDEITLDDPRLSVRETEWIPVTESEMALLGINKWQPQMPYIRPTDGGRDFMDCSLWVIFGAYFTPAGLLAPLRPYYVYAPDFIQRYVPQIYGNKIDANDVSWNITTALLLTIRGAEKVLVTTPKTGEDAVGYAGAAPDKVVLMPLWSIELIATGTPVPQGASRSYALWVSNSTPHKNHLCAIAALERYYEMGGDLDTVLIGPDTTKLSPLWHRRPRDIKHPYWTRVADRIAETRSVRQRLKFLDEVSDEKYVSLVSGARFVWHNVLYDNGSFVALEAARLGTPLLSSDYPQMRYICDLFSIPARFFPPVEIEETAKALRQMERDTGEGRLSVSYRMPDHWQQWIEQSFGELLLSHASCARTSDNWQVPDNNNT